MKDDPRQIQLLFDHIDKNRCQCTCEWWYGWNNISFTTFTIMHNHNQEHQCTFEQLIEDPDEFAVTARMIRWVHAVTARCGNMP